MYICVYRELMGSHITVDSVGGGSSRIHTCHAQHPPVSSDAILTKNSHICGARSAFGMAPARVPPNADRAMFTISWAVAPSNAISSCTKCSPPAHIQPEVSTSGHTCAGWSARDTANSLSMPDTEDLCASATTRDSATLPAAHRG